MLRAATGKHFGYTVYAPVDQRAVGDRRRGGMARRARTTGDRSTFPLRSRPFLGRLLVCDHAQNLLVEFDTDAQASGKPAAGTQPWACQGLANGHRLVGSYHDKSIVEYDARGPEVWRYAGLPGGPTSVERLENGNTLVACTDAGEVRGDRSGQEDRLEGRRWKAARSMPAAWKTAARSSHCSTPKRWSSSTPRASRSGKSAGVGHGVFRRSGWRAATRSSASIGAQQVREFDRAAASSGPRATSPTPTAPSGWPAATRSSSIAAGVTEDRPARQGRQPAGPSQSEPGVEDTEPLTFAVTT